MLLFTKQQAGHQRVFLEETTFYETGKSSGLPCPSGAGVTKPLPSSSGRRDMGQQMSRVGSETPAPSGSGYVAEVEQKTIFCHYIGKFHNATKYKVKK